MSIFEKPADQQDIEIDTSNITLDTLVGDGQKYKTPDDLAKAYVHSDAFIEKMKEKVVQIEAENKVLRDLKEAQNNNQVEPPKAPNDDSGNEPPRNQRPEGNEEQKDLSALVREELDRQKKETSFSENVNNVSEKLASFYGGEKQARDAVHKKAAELKVSTEWLMDIAGRSPVAFYSTLGIDQQSFSTPNATSDVNTAAFNKDRSRRNFAYWEELRKTNPKTYYSAQMRKDMFNDAREQGDKFYT
jgi:hypothetical protein